MKKIIHSLAAKGLLLLLTVFAFQVPLFAQDKIEIDKKEVGNWFEQNWMWVAGGVLLILLIVVFSGSKSRRKTISTTVVKDQFGDTKRVTTTTETES